MQLLVRRRPLSLHTGTYQTSANCAFCAFFRHSLKTGSQVAPLPGSENRGNRDFSNGGLQLIPPVRVEGGNSRESNDGGRARWIAQDSTHTRRDAPFRKFAGRASAESRGASNVSGPVMNLNEHERPRPNPAGRVSPMQQAEMKMLLAGGWPPLKPLPVFKYETDAYRVSIDFDKLRGEWVCRKTSLPSNKAQELRGGLKEIIRALPNGQAEVFTACSAAGRQEHELDKDVSRRLQAILEWKANYENGVLYSGLRDFLSESQQQEIEEILRLTLTARQLQFSPKNVSYVFDALSKAGGKLATLIEIAQRNKMGQQADVPAKTETAAPVAERDVPVASLIPAALESLPEEPTWSVLPEQDQPSSPQWIEDTASQASEIVTPAILDADPPSFAEDLQEEVRHEAPVTDSGPQVRTRKLASSVDRIENSPSRSYVLEISGVHVAAFAVVFLFAVIGLTAGLTAGRGPLGQWLSDTGKSILADDATSPALPNRPAEATSRTSPPSATNTFPDSAHSPSANKLVDAAPSEEKPRESSRSTESSTKAPSTHSSSSPTVESEPSVTPGPGPGRNRPAGLIARNAPPPASPKFALSPKALGPISDAQGNPAPRRIARSTGTLALRSTSSAILVTAPAYGSKPFRVTFPEKPIAATASLAMTSVLSVLVPPQRGPAVAHRPARLQAGELLSFVWPRYSRAGDRYAVAETVKVRTTIGPFGQVQDIKLLSGSTSLLPATMNAIRQWRYRPTLLNKRPVQVQQDVTIEFRPPQSLSQVRNQPQSRK
jgi:Gram-negative bacterial TonB protein C-terminal